MYNTVRFISVDNHSCRRLNTKCKYICFFCSSDEAQGIMIHLSIKCGGSEVLLQARENVLSVTVELARRGQTY